MLWGSGAPGRSMVTARGGSGLGIPPTLSPRPIMFPGPVFHLELRRIARRKRYYLLLTLYGLLLLWVVWSIQPQPPMPSPSARLSIIYSQSAGKSLFQT